MKAILLTGPEPPDIYAIADSAIGRDVMPLFVPDGEWEAEARVAFRVVRLGKCVRRKFALTYVDAASVVLLIKPKGADEYPRWLSIMDSAATTGQWLTIPAGQAMAKVAWADGEAQITFNPEECLPQAIEAVTSLATIKTGDIIIPCLPAVPVPLARNTKVQAWIDGQQCLNLKIK